MAPKLVKEKPIDPTTVSANSAQEYAARGWIFYGRAQFDRAEADFRKSLELEPVNVDVLFALGLTLNATSRSAEAMDVFNQALSAASNMTDPVRKVMVSRLLRGHISHIKTGDWSLTR